MALVTSSLLELLSTGRGTLHVIDPFKVSIREAVEKVQVLTELRFPGVLVGSTDCVDFESHVPPYLDELRKACSLPILLHFPPQKGLGFSLCRADALILHSVPCALDPYFTGPCVRDALARLRASNSAIEVLRSASFTFGQDAKTLEAVTAMPAPESLAHLKRYALTVADEIFDIAYLYSRHSRVPLGACQLFRSLLRPGQLLFVSGGVTTAGQAASYLDAGADFVVFGAALERPDWFRSVLSLAIRRGSRNGRQ